MIRAFYILSIVFLISFSILIKRKVIEKKFFKKDLLPINLYLDRRFWIFSLTTPKDYFRKDKFWKGYFLSILNLILLILSIYFLIKFIILSS